MDLGAELRPEKTTWLLELIMELPMTARWREAASVDVEYMKKHRDPKKDREEQRKKWAPRLSEYGLEAMLLLNLTNLVGALASGKRINGFENMRPPITALEVIDQNEELFTAIDLINHLTPGRLKKEE